MQYGVEMRQKHLDLAKRKQLLNIKSKREKYLTIEINLQKITGNT